MTHELQVAYQPALDLLFAWIGEPEPGRSIEVADGIYVRVAPAGNRVLGLEILDCAARFHVDPSSVNADFAAAKIEEFNGRALESARWDNVREAKAGQNASIDGEARSEVVDLKALPIAQWPGTLRQVGTHTPAVGCGGDRARPVSSFDCRSSIMSQVWETLTKRYECQHCGAVHPAERLKFSGGLWCNRCDEVTESPAVVLFGTEVEIALSALRNEATRLVDDERRRWYAALEKAGVCDLEGLAPEVVAEHVALLFVRAERAEAEKERLQGIEEAFQEERTENHRNALRADAAEAQVEQLTQEKAKIESRREMYAFCLNSQARAMTIFVDEWKQALSELQHLRQSRGEPIERLRCTDRCGLLRCRLDAGHDGLHECYNAATGEMQQFRGAEPTGGQE